MVVPLLIGGALIVGGIAASGYLADAIANVLSEQGKQTQFNDVDDLADELVRTGRYDLAVQLQQNVAFANSAAFSTEPQDNGILGGILGGNTTQLALLALVGYMIIKK